MDFAVALKMTGLVAFCITLVVIGYLMYEKDEVISMILIIVGMAMGIALVISEINFKTRRHEVPWQFEKYKGE